MAECRKREGKKSKIRAKSEVGSYPESCSCVIRQQCLTSLTRMLHIYNLRITTVLLWQMPYKGPRIEHWHSVFQTC